MVAIRDTHVKDRFDMDLWLSSIHVKQAENRKVLEDTFEYCSKLCKDEKQVYKLQKRCAEMIGILEELHMDFPSIQVAVLYIHYTEHLLSVQQVAKDFSQQVSSIMQGAISIEAIKFLRNVEADVTESRINDIRTMLTVLVKDVRTAIIKLAERIAYLREVKNAKEETKVLAAKEVTSFYAPLANRLGIGQLKWELEDLAFRYLHPDSYKQIAKLIDEKRKDRQEYIDQFVSELKKLLRDAGLVIKDDSFNRNESDGLADSDTNSESTGEAQIESVKPDVGGVVVYGRPKHIYSIWRKMQKKNLDYSQLYDVRAVRVITEDLEECYIAQSEILNHWESIPSEYDDYIKDPKPNGYQSIHLVVIGKGNKPVEIQIRTEKMHRDAELGVAAHWKYKESNGDNKKSDYEEKLSWLRRHLEFQYNKGNIVDSFRADIFDDTVYVFTPKGDLKELPAGSTPLDAAYEIHTNIGHRCVGAKVDGKIVPLTYQLKSGQQVEIITRKEINPSRDWMNPENGYLKTSKARGKVAAWFRRIERDKNLELGRDIFKKEFVARSLPVDKDSYQKCLEMAVKKYNVPHEEDFFVQLGIGAIKINQFLNYFEQVTKTADEEDLSILEKFDKTSSAVRGNEQSKEKSNNNIIINGVGNLLMHLCKKCKPVPGDDITGFITQGRGITIHRCDCENLKEQKNHYPERIVDADWEVSSSHGYAITVRIVSTDRSGLLRDITAMIANDRLNVIGIQSRSNVKNQTASIDIDMEVNNIGTINRIISKLSQIDGVINVKRL